MTGDMTIKEQTRQIVALLVDIKSLLEKNNKLLDIQVQYFRNFYYHFKEDKERFSFNECVR